MSHQDVPKILCVDDDAASRRHLGALLRAEGFEVWEAGSGHDALRQIERHPHVILLDVNLPDLDGFEVCRRIRANPAAAATPILQLSGYYVDDQARVRALEGGADGYLTKPVEPSVLVAHIHTLLRVQAAEESLRQAAHQWQATFDAVPDGVCLLQRDGTVLRCNRAMARIVGRAPEELVGRVLPGWLTPLASSTAEDQPLVNREVALAGRCYSVRTIGVHDGGKDGEELVQVWEDITDRLRAEEQLRLAQKMEAVGRLAGGVAHDFNNLLTIIGGYVDVLLRQTPPESPAIPLLQHIRKADERAATLTRQLLAFSRKQISQPVLLDLNVLVAEREAMLQTLIGPDIQMALILDPALGKVTADPDQIEQILINLVMNARDAMPQGGRLTIETDDIHVEEASAASEELRPGRYALLAVTDTGFGMDEATRARIFEPFYTTKEFGKGTGLGLAMVYGIVEQAGGHIDVSSELGRGTAFTIYLPCSDPPTLIEETPECSESAGAKQQME